MKLPARAMTIDRSRSCCAAARCTRIAASCCIGPAASWDSTHAISDSIQVTTSRDVLAAMARGEGPEMPSSRWAMRVGSRPAGARTEGQRLAHLPVRRGIAVRACLMKIAGTPAWRSLGVDVSTRQPTSPDMPEVPSRPATPRIVLAFRFRPAAHRPRRSATPLTRTAAPRCHRAHPRNRARTGPPSSRGMQTLGPDLLVVGAPYNDDGSPGRIAAAADAFAAQLAAALRARGGRASMNATRRRGRQPAARAARLGPATTRSVRKGDVDSAAAAVMLRALAREHAGRSDEQR